MDENMNCTPTPEETPAPAPESAPAAEPVGAAPAAPAPAKKAPLKLILIAAAVAVVAICAAVFFITRNSATSVAERYIKATFTDVKTAASLCAYDFKEFRLASYDGDEEAFFENMSDQYDADISSWNDFYKALDTSRAEEFEDQYEKYKITVEATKTKDVSVRSVLEDYEWFIEDLESDTDFDSDKISDAKLVTVRLKIAGEDGILRNKYEVCMVKIGGFWRVLGFNSVD